MRREERGERRATTRKKGHNKKSQSHYPEKEENKIKKFKSSTEAFSGQTKF